MSTPARVDPRRQLHMGRKLKLLVIATAAIIVVPTVAHAEDPIFIGWTDYLPRLGPTYDADSANDCTAGREQCVHAVIREMTKRFDALSATCNHDALFA